MMHQSQNNGYIMKHDYEMSTNNNGISAMGGLPMEMPVPSIFDPIQPPPHHFNNSTNKNDTQMKTDDRMDTMGNLLKDKKGEFEHNFPITSYLSSHHCSVFFSISYAKICLGKVKISWPSTNTISIQLFFLLYLLLMWKSQELMFSFTLVRLILFLKLLKNLILRLIHSRLLSNFNVK